MCKRVGNVGAQRALNFPLLFSRFYNPYLMDPQDLETLNVLLDRDVELREVTSIRTLLRGLEQILSAEH
jgi:hypothetical protein